MIFKDGVLTNYHQNIKISKMNTSESLRKVVFTLAASEMNAYFTENGTYKALNPIISHVGDFSPFYIAIAICTVILCCIIILNIVCCCSRYSDYWLDRHTGNRWIVSIWSATPHKQPPLDFTELKSAEELEVYIQRSQEVHHREVTPSVSQQPLTSQLYSDLHTRESDI